MSNMNRLAMDRRSGDDRRQSYRLGYFMNGGIERRSGKERRLMGERRIGWVRATEWSSVPGIVANTTQDEPQTDMPSNLAELTIASALQEESAPQGRVTMRTDNQRVQGSVPWNGDKRSGIERRRFSYNAHIPERRSGLDRRTEGMRQEQYFPTDMQAFEEVPIHPIG
jgi:hypothetical protein